MTILRNDLMTNETSKGCEKPQFQKMHNNI